MQPHDYRFLVKIDRKLVKLEFTFRINVECCSDVTAYFKNCNQMSADFKSCSQFSNYDSNFQQFAVIARNVIVIFNILQSKFKM